MEHKSKGDWLLEAYTGLGDLLLGSQLVFRPSFPSSPTSDHLHQKSQVFGASAYISLLGRLRIYVIKMLSWGIRMLTAVWTITLVQSPGGHHSHPTCFLDGRSEVSGIRSQVRAGQVPQVQQQQLCGMVSVGGRGRSQPRVKTQASSVGRVRASPRSRLLLI